MLRLLQSILLSILIANLAACKPPELDSESQETILDEPLKMGIAHCCAPDDLFTQAVLNLIKESGDKVENLSLDTHYALGDRDKQKKQLNELISSGAQAIIMSPVIIGDEADLSFQKEIIDIVKSANVPIVFYVKKIDEVVLNSYEKAFFVGTISAESAIQQAQMIVNHWKADPSLDKNGDGVIQYAVLRGTKGNFDAETRTKWVGATIENYPGEGIEAEMIELGLANWSTDNAYEFVKTWLQDPIINNKLEVIVSNSDGMAFGAVKALKESNMNIPVYGVNALPKALTLIKDGDISGTISQDTPGQAREIINLAVNLAVGRPLSTGTILRAYQHELMVENIPIDSTNINDFIQ